MRSIVENYLSNISGIENLDFLDKGNSGYFEYAGKNDRYECMLDWSYFIEKKDGSEPASISIMASPPSISVSEENRVTILEFINSANSAVKIGKLILNPSGFVSSEAVIYADTNDILNESVLKAIFTETIVYLEICSPLILGLINSEITLEEAKKTWQDIPKLFYIQF